MEQNLEKLSDSIDEIKTLINTFNTTLENIEKRLSHFEKMDSIEHRVEVNQIDLTDIKEALERIEGRHKDEVINIIRDSEKFIEQEKCEQVKYIHSRLDSHLVKLAKVEEDILILKAK